MQKRKIAQPNDWKTLPYYAPYYLNVIAPDRLQIWVKPRYWFAAVIALVAGGWVFLSFLSYDTFDAILRPLFSVFVGENAKGKVTDAYNLRFLLMLPIGLILGAAIFHYKRRGLIEIAPEGIWIVDDPRFSPEGARLIDRADILGFDDGDLYTSTGKFSRVRSGTELRVVMQPGKGADVDLVKIWGVDGLNKADYHALREAIVTAFEAGKKSKRSRKPGEAFGEPVPGENPAALATFQEKRKQYLAWEKLYCIFTLVIAGGHFAHAAFVPLGNRLDKLWWLYALALVVMFFHAYWLFVLRWRRTMWRVLILWPIVAVAAIGPAYWAYEFRERQIRPGISLWGEATGVMSKPLIGGRNYDVAMRYTYADVQYAGLCESYDAVRPGTKLKVHISAAFPRIYECDSFLWREPNKKKKRNKR